MFFLIIRAFHAKSIKKKFYPSSSYGTHHKSVFTEVSKLGVNLGYVLNALEGWNFFLVLSKWNYAIIIENTLTFEINVFSPNFGNFIDLFSNFRIKCCHYQRKHSELKKKNGVFRKHCELQTHWLSNIVIGWTISKIEE